MNIAAIYHRPGGSMGYPLDASTLHIRLRVAKGDLDCVKICIGDPYDWEKGGGGGNLVAADAYGWVGGKTMTMELEGSTALHDYYHVFFKPQYLRARYAFILEKGDRRVLYGEKRVNEITEENFVALTSEMGNFFCFPFLNAADVSNAPEWAKNMVWYQIFADRFRNGDHSNDPEPTSPWGAKPLYYNHFGGDLRGVIDRLDYLQELGITGIYFCPIFKAPTNHKYDTTDYYEIDPNFGTKEEFKELMDEAKKRNMKIMLDIVINHIGEKSKFWLDVLENQEKSIYKDWFHINHFPVDPNVDMRQDFNYFSFAFSNNMPKLNTSNPECKKYLLDMTAYWVKEFGVDGIRLDVANEVDHAFWRDFKSTLKAINPEIYIIGEIWHDALPWLGNDQFDSVMNYPLGEAILNFFALNTTNATQFKDAMNLQALNYPLNASESMFNLLDSHDTARLLHQCNGNKKAMKLSLLALFSIAGSPCIYYGTEVGMTGGSDPDNRRCMDWDILTQDLDMYNFVKKLIVIRHQYPATKSTKITWLEVSDEQVSGYIKNSQLIYLFNNSDQAKSIALDSSTYLDLLTDQEFIVDKTLTLSPYQGLILIKK